MPIPCQQKLTNQTNQKQSSYKDSAIATLSQNFPEASSLIIFSESWNFFDMPGYIMFKKLLLR